MKLSAGQRALVIVLIVAGIYMLVWHADPLPLNHEAIGLGTLHIIHAVVGIVLLIGAVWIVWRARRQKPAAQG